MKHHTKFKGDIGVTQVIADLTKRNIDCCLPLSEHLPFDIVAFNSHGKMARIQVRYAKMFRTSIPLKLRCTQYNNTRGAYNKIFNTSKIDGFSVYCPDTNLVYYISKYFTKNKKNCFWLQVIKMIKNCNWHEDFLNPNILFR